MSQNGANSQALKEDLLTRIKDGKGKVRKLTALPVPLYSLITVQLVKILPKGIQKRNYMTAKLE